eukprot:c8624_g2_i1 orf=175-390(+)
MQSCRLIEAPNHSATEAKNVGNNKAPLSGTIRSPNGAALIFSSIATGAASYAVPGYVFEHQVLKMAPQGIL